MKYCQQGDLANALDEYIRLWAIGIGNTGNLEAKCHQLEDFLLFVLSLMVFGFDETVINKGKIENKKLKNALKEMRSLGFLSSEKGNDDVLRISPVFLRLWIGTRKKDSASDKKEEDEAKNESKQDNMKGKKQRHFSDNFCAVLQLLFDKLENKGKWTDSDFEDLAATLVLLRVNCANYLVKRCMGWLSMDDEQKKRFTTFGGILGVKGKIGELEVNFERINLGDRYQQKRFTNPSANDSKYDKYDWFAGITDIEGDKSEKKILNLQLQSIRLLGFHSKNLYFDKLVRLFAKEYDKPHNFPIEIKGNADIVGTPLNCAKNKSVQDAIGGQYDKFLGLQREVAGKKWVTLEVGAFYKQSHYLGYLFFEPQKSCNTLASLFVSQVVKVLMPGEYLAEFIQYVVRGK